MSSELRRIQPWVGVGFHTDAMSPLWKATTTYHRIRRLAPERKPRSVSAMNPALWRIGLVGLFLAALPAAFAQPTTSLENMEIFLLIGQSNMAGRGKVEAEDQVPHPRVFMLTKDLTWVPAVDPMHYDKPNLIGTGLGKTFGALVAEADPTAVIGLVPAAFGGSALDEWTPGAPHYVNAVARARVAMKQGRLAGILWHQGEADRAPDKAATYPVRFAKFIAHLRADLDAQEVTVIVGELGRFCSNEGPVNAAIRQLPGLVPHCAFVSAEGLADQGDKIHFGSPAFRELGRRYAAAWQTLQSAPVTKLRQ